MIVYSFFSYTDTATTDIYTLSLHDALPILPFRFADSENPATIFPVAGHIQRSEEHTSELQSRFDLVCRLLLEKKKNHIHNAVVPRRYGFPGGLVPGMLVYASLTHPLVAPSG